MGKNVSRHTDNLKNQDSATGPQEQLLALESVDGVEPITERAVRRVVRASGWEKQREAWKSWGLDDSAVAEPDLLPT
jgi:hypothetical protein